MLPKLQPQKEIIVDGVKYVVQLYPPTIGFRLYAKLFRLLGEPIVKMLAMLPKGKSIKDLGPDDVNLDQAGEALQSLFSKLGEDDFLPLLQEILSSTYHSKSLQCVNDTFETEFAGRYKHVFILVAKTLGVQFPDFLSGIVKRTSAVKDAPASQSQAEAS